MRADPARDPADDGGTKPERAGWGRLAQDLAATLWPSFLAASVATMFFFAFVDPALFGDGAVASRWPAHRMGGYAIGFFFFWAVCTLSSALTLYLLRTAAPRGPRAER